jgi:RNA polymerase sigma-70 factor (ECF subfamily)
MAIADGPSDPPSHSVISAVGITTKECGGVTSWFDTSAPAHRPRYPAGADELDELLTAVGTDRDGAAFTVLFDHFRPRVHAQMLRLGLAPFVAADVTQDVMETIWRKAHLFDRHKSAAATWVFHIARNRRIDVRRRSRQQHFANEDLLTIPDPSEGSDDCLDVEQRGQCVRAALDALPEEQLRLVRLAFFEGLSHAAIAQRTELPLGTVKSRLRLAVARLRRCLHDAGVTEV